MLTEPLPFNVTPRTLRLRALNDEVRRALPITPARVPSAFYMSEGLVLRFDADEITAILELVRGYPAACFANDAFDQHASGTVYHRAPGGTAFVPICWCFEYWAPDLSGPAADPADPRRSFRLLSLHLAHEHCLWQAAQLLIRGAS